MSETRDLEPVECLRLLRSGVVGRVALSTPEGPHIVPVNYAIFEDTIVVRTSTYSLLGTYGRNAMLAFEVDDVDHDRHVGWSVVARGRAWAELDTERDRRDAQRLAPAPLGGRRAQPLPPHAVGDPDRPGHRLRRGDPDLHLGPDQHPTHPERQLTDKMGP